MPRRPTTSMPPTQSIRPRELRHRKLRCRSPLRRGSRASAYPTSAQRRPRRSAPPHHAAGPGFPRHSRIGVHARRSHARLRSCRQVRRTAPHLLPRHRATLPRAECARALRRRRGPPAEHAHARVPRECRLNVGGHSSHDAARSCTERERPPAGAVPFHRAEADHRQRSTARARGKLACFVTSRETASAVAVRATRKPAACWRPQLARRTTVLHRRRETSRRCSEILSSVVRSHPARHGARAQQARVFTTSREIASAVGLASVPHEFRLRVGGHSSNVAPRSCTEERGLPSVQCPFIFHSTRRDRSQRGTARARGKLVLPPPERQPPQWRLSACHVNAGYALEATARTSPHGLAPKKRGLTPVQCPFKVRRLITSSVARRARAVSLRVLPPPERQPPKWRSRACHANAGYALETTARTSHHGLAPKERGLPPVQCPFVVQGATAANAARRAHAASLRVLQPS